jgi:hypothetical protein
MSDAQSFLKNSGFVNKNTVLPKAALKAGKRILTEADAIDIWIARWLRVPLKELLARYVCDSRRLYDIWWGLKHPASKAKAQKLFRERYPTAAERIDFGYRRIPRGRDDDPAQPTLFD